jgi:hypothetical protein
MTPAEEALYEYLVAHNSIYGKLPTQKEIAFELRKERSVISKQMLNLAKQGKLVAKYNLVTYSLT